MAEAGRRVPYLAHPAEELEVMPGPGLGVKLDEEGIVMGRGTEGAWPKKKGRIVADPALGFRCLDFIYFPILQSTGNGQSSA